MLIDAVERQVVAKVCAGRKFAWLDFAGFDDFEERAGPWVALAEEQEVEGEVAREDGEVRLHMAGREAACGLHEVAVAHHEAEFGRGFGQGGECHCGVSLFICYVSGFALIDGLRRCKDVSASEHGDKGD